jgi:hypothetical protein
MDYFETLRRDGWLADPSDRVRVLAIHGESCPARRGCRCRCEPRLVLSSDWHPDGPGRPSVGLQPLEAAAGE